MSAGTSLGQMRWAAKLVFGAFLSLFVTSFLALPCLQADRGLIISIRPLSQAARSVRSFKTPSQTPAHDAASTVPFGMARMSMPLAKMLAVSSSVQYASAWKPFPASTLSESPSRPAAAPSTAVPSFPAAPSCAASALFKPQANLLKLFEIPLTVPLLRLAFTLIAVLGLPVVVSMSVRPPLRARPGWIRLRSLPFASSKRLFLPPFAAFRDA